MLTLLYKCCIPGRLLGIAALAFTADVLPLQGVVGDAGERGPPGPDGSEVKTHLPPDEFSCPPVCHAVFIYPLLFQLLCPSSLKSHSISFIIVLCHSSPIYSTE